MYHRKHRRSCCASNPITGPSAAQAATLSACRDLRRRYPTLTIVALASSEEPAVVNEALAAGVPVVHTRYMGVNHGFARKLAVIDAARTAADQVASSLRAALTF